MSEFISLMGVMNGKDTATGLKVPLSAVQDNNGNWVLRTVDSAPFGFDNVSDALKTLRTNKKIITTIANNISLSPLGVSANFPLGANGTESEVWVAVSINKQPWTLKGNNDFGGVWTDAFYPIRENATNVCITSMPALSLALGTVIAASMLPRPTSIIEAKAYAQPLNINSYVNITNNHTTDTAIATITVIRIWR